MGGHVTPISTEGASLLWKKAQKKAKKKQTSDVIKRIMPYRRPFSTIAVCLPWKVASRIMSRHHFTMVVASSKNPIVRRVSLLVWNHKTSPEVIISPLIAPVRGHGL